MTNPANSMCIFAPNDGPVARIHGERRAEINLTLNFFEELKRLSPVSTALEISNEDFPGIKDAST